MPDVEIVNVVGMLTFEQELDLGALAETFTERDEICDVTFEPAENHWLQTRFGPDGAYVAFYRSGQASIAGCDSIDQFEEIAGRVLDVMRELLPVSCNEPEIEVKNIVATKDLGSPLDLELLALGLGLEAVEYEPEQFPALIYRAVDHVLLVFSSGNVVCTGLTDPDDVAPAIDDFRQQIDSL